MFFWEREKTIVFFWNEKTLSSWVESNRASQTRQCFIRKKCWPDREKTEKTHLICWIRPAVAAYVTGHCILPPYPKNFLTKHMRWKDGGFLAGPTTRVRLKSNVREHLDS